MLYYIMYFGNIVSGLISCTGEKIRIAARLHQNHQRRRSHACCWAASGHMPHLPPAAWSACAGLHQQFIFTHLCKFLMRQRFLKNQPCDATLTPGGCTFFGEKLARDLITLQNSLLVHCQLAASVVSKNEKKKLRQWTLSILHMTKSRPELFVYIFFG